MIGILEITEGYATKLERLKHPIEFKLGLNILFGPNGCGKSSASRLLRLTAASIVRAPVVGAGHGFTNLLLLAASAVRS